MNETRHTPGPWRVSSTDIAIPTGATVEVAPEPGMFDITVLATNGEGRLIAIADERGVKLNPTDYLPVAESTANMRLIAAAPDLLAACEEAREWIGDVPEGDGGYYFGLRQVVRALDAAIAAAKGGAS